ncbi:MAG: long-chain fatty acid--CoA ligase [Burkholderiales bacterium]
MEWLLDRFASAATHRAFVHEGREVTYGDVVAKTRAYGDDLAARGVEAGQTVAVLGDYSPEVVCFLFALFRNGNIVVPMTRDAVIEEAVALGLSGCDWFAEFSREGASMQFSARRVASDIALLADFRRSRRPGLVLFSSGSTGEPKGILHDFTRIAEKFRKQRAPIVAIPFLMLDHFGGINTILAILSSLGTAVTVGSRAIEPVCAAIARHRVQLLPATPSFLTMLLASNLHRKYDLSSLTRITYGTEVMPQATLDRLRAEFPGVELQQTYGLSEVGVLRTQSRPDGTLWMRMGGEGFETKVVDGILWIRSTYRMVGYLNADSEFDEDGWFNTKDQVEVDGDYLKVLGRVTDIINVGGQKVYPAEVENVILGVANVTDVVVCAEANALLGQIVVAKVVLAHPEATADIKARVRAACLARLAPFKVPAKVVVTSEALYSKRHKKVRTA